MEILIEASETIDDIIINCAKQIKFINSEFGYFNISLDIKEIIKKELENYFIK
jgi:hypothetical protein